MDPNGPTKNETLFGGIDLEVTLVTPGEASNYTTETIRVHQLPVRQYPNYVAAMENEAEMVKLFTGKSDDWADRLTPASFEKIVIEGERINADFFGRWYQRLLDRQERLVPGIAEQRRAEVLRLQTSSLKSSPNPSGQ